MRIRIEQGPRNKKSVAYAIDWAGFERGAGSDEFALERLEEYRRRFEPVAALAGMAEEYGAETPMEIDEVYVGASSTDFWGISFSSSPSEVEEPYRQERIERDLALLQASWQYFDLTASRVGEDMRSGPRGASKSRTDVIQHVFGSERTQMAPKVGVKTPPGVMLTEDGLRAHREEFLYALRQAGARGNKAGRTWSLSYLIRHTAGHSVDHAWEMEDKDLTNTGGE